MSCSSSTEQGLDEPSPALLHTGNAEELQVLHPCPAQLSPSASSFEKRLQCPCASLRCSQLFSRSCFEAKIPLQSSPSSSQTPAAPPEKRGPPDELLHLPLGETFQKDFFFFIIFFPNDFLIAGNLLNHFLHRNCSWRCFALVAAALEQVCHHFQPEGWCWVSCSGHLIFCVPLYFPACLCGVFFFGLFLWGPRVFELEQCD